MFKRILVLAPHTDDGEFGCGATMAKFIQAKKQVYYAAFSSAEKSLSAGLPRDTLKKEVQAATMKLGIKAKHLILFDYEVRNFLAHRQKILEDMVRLNREIRPDLVFLPSSKDTHQDHQVISDEGVRAFKKVSILGYEIPWNNLSFNTNFFIFLKEKHIQKKIEALKCYKSQRDRYYANEEFIRSLARTRGTQIGTKYAEVFDAIRWVIR